jgi:hypothetical protein
MNGARFPGGWGRRKRWPSYVDRWRRGDGRLPCCLGLRPTVDRRSWIPAQASSCCPGWPPQPSLSSW